LGDADADTDDALKWIKKNKKREKALAKKRQAELESMDKVFQEEYTESVFRLHLSFSIPLILISRRGLGGFESQPRPQSARGW
jgi:hypothetical protein